MGTIADKLLHLDGTKAALRKAINDAGGYLTVDSTFRSYAGEWLREKSATLSLDFWCERFITRRQGSLAPFAIGSGIVNFTHSTAGGRFNEYGLYVNEAIDAWRLDHDPASLTTSSSTASFDSSVASFELPSGHAFFVGDLLRATAVAGSLWGVVVARSATSVVVHVRNSNATGSASSWTCIKPLGLLIEEQRTNVITRSNNYTDGSWTRSMMTLGAGVTSPDGTNNAITLVEDSGTGIHGIYKTALVFPVSTTFSHGWVVKRKDRRYVRLYYGNSSNFSSVNTATFDLQNKSVVSGVGTVQDLGNGWLYLSRPTTSGASAPNTTVNLAISDSPTNFSYTGDGVSGIYLWHCQHEVGGFASSITPTEASQVTRAADVASVNTLSPWYNASEGSLFVEASSFGLGSSSTSYAAGLTDGTGNEVITIRRNSTGFGAAVIDGGVDQATFAPTYTNGLKTKIALAYRVNDFALSKDGAVPLTDTSGTIPTVDRLNIGSTGILTSFNNGHIRSLRYWSKRDMPIQEMTA